MSSALHYVTFPTLHDEPLTMAARLQVPEAEGAHPAVIILHGSGGPSGREGGYAEALGEANIATLELDQWSPRGLAGGAEGRPRTVHETLPDLYGARAFLAAHPRIDAGRIGAMGFSFGGVACMLAATRAQNARFLGEDRFAALAPFYPVCHLYNRAPGFEFADLVGAPMLLATAALDGYDNDPEAGPKLVASLGDADRALIRAEVIPNAHHAFEVPKPERQNQDPSGNRGQGGLVTMAYNPQATAQGHALAVSFFRDALGV